MRARQEQSQTPAVPSGGGRTVRIAPRVQRGGMDLLDQDADTLPAIVQPGAPLTLHRATGHARDEVPLEEEEQDDHRNGDDEDACRRQGIVD